jgi:hypothetical protein
MSRQTTTGAEVEVEVEVANKRLTRVREAERPAPVARFLVSAWTS